MILGYGGSVMNMHYCQGGKNKKNTVHLQLWGEINLAYARLQNTEKKLTVGVIAQSRVKKNAGLVLRLPSHVDSKVQVFNPLPHLHLGAGIIQTCEVKNKSFHNYWKSGHLCSHLAATTMVLCAA